MKNCKMVIISVAPSCLQKGDFCSTSSFILISSSYLSKKSGFSFRFRSFKWLNDQKEKDFRQFFVFLSEMCGILANCLFQIFPKMYGILDDGILALDCIDYLQVSRKYYVKDRLFFIAFTHFYPRNYD